MSNVRRLVTVTASWNYGKLSAKFLVSCLKVVDTVGFLSFFESFTQTTIKIPLNCYSVKGSRSLQPLFTKSIAKSHISAQFFVRVFVLGWYTYFETWQILFSLCFRE